MRSTLKSEIQRLTGDVAPVKEKFEKGGSVIDYVNAYSESHPAEVDKAFKEKHVTDNTLIFWKVKRSSQSS